MRKIYIHEMFPAPEHILTRLQQAGITCELRINAHEGKFPYCTFSELWLAEDEDYNRALSLITIDQRRTRI